MYGMRAVTYNEAGLSGHSRALEQSKIFARRQESTDEFLRDRFQDLAVTIKPNG